MHMITKLHLKLWQTLKLEGRNVVSMVSPGNYGYLVHTCSEPCADLGLVYFFDSMHDSDCSATLNPHKSQPSWSHVKRSQPAAWK